ncbi:MAG: hypothetical protein ACYDG6_02445 [Thermincolia bacterium]
MFRKTWLIVLAIIITLISVGCGEKENKTATNSGDAAKFDAAAAIKDFNDMALAEKINSYLIDGEVDKAVITGEAAMKKEPENLAVLLNLSNAYYYQKDFMNMIKVSRKMEEISPQNPGVLNQLAWALIDSGENPAEGLKKVEKAIQIVTSSGQLVHETYIDTYAYGLYKVGKKSEGIAQWQRVLPRVQSGDIYLHLGQALLETGKKSEAQPVLEKGLSFTKIQMKDANLPKAELKRLEEVKAKFENHLKTLKTKKS